MHLRALRIDARHHVFNHVVLPCRVHPLKDEQHGVAIVGVEARLQLVQPLETFLAMTVHLLSALEGPREIGRMPPDGAFIVRPDAKSVDVHGASVSAGRGSDRASRDRLRQTRSSAWQNLPPATLITVW